MSVAEIKAEVAERLLQSSPRIMRILLLIASTIVSACSPAASQSLASSPALTYSGPGESQRPMSVMERAARAASGGQTELALRDYLWALDHGVGVDPSFVGIRNTLLIQKLLELGAAEPSVLAELETRAARLEQSILASTRDADVGLYVALNRERNQRERTQRVYHQLRQQGSPVADELYADVFEVLLQERKYADILAREDWYKRSLAFKQWLVTDAIASFRSLAADVFESLAGTNRNQDAMALLSRVEALDPSAESFVTFVKRALRAGNKELARLVLVRGRERVSPGEQPLLTQAARELGLE